jgi:hypothetical protein
MEAWELARIRVNLLKQAGPDDEALAAEGKRDVLAPLKNLLQPVLSASSSLRRPSQSSLSSSVERRPSASRASASPAGPPSVTAH